MALVAWHAQVLVFHDVLLDNCGSRVLPFGLPNGVLVHVSLGNVPVVAWNVAGHLRASNAQIVVFIILFLVAVVELGSWVRAVGTECSLGFGVIERSLR